MDCVWSMACLHRNPRDSFCFRQALPSVHKREMAKKKIGLLLCVRFRREFIFDSLFIFNLTIWNSSGVQNRFKFLMLELVTTGRKAINFHFSASANFSFRKRVWALKTNREFSASRWVTWCEHYSRLSKCESIIKCLFIITAGEPRESITVRCCLHFIALEHKNLTPQRWWWLQDVCGNVRLKNWTNS